MANNEPAIYRSGMVVVAHADDAEWGCSGTVAKWCREGMDVVYVICTDGSKGSSDPDITSQQLVDIRHKEQEAAARVLGVKQVVFLDYEDSMLQPTLELRRDIAREIRRYRPDVIICSAPQRNLNQKGYVGHPDHLAAGEATLSAVFPASRDRLTFPELLEAGLEPHKIREVLISDSENANKWIDVSEVIEIAINALQQHVSQIGDADVGLGMRRSRARAGEPNGIPYAEAFRSFLFNV